MRNLSTNIRTTTKDSGKVSHSGSAKQIHSIFIQTAALRKSTKRLTGKATCIHFVKRKRTHTYFKRFGWPELVLNIFIKVSNIHQETKKKKIENKRFNLIKIPIQAHLPITWLSLFIYKHCLHQKNKLWFNLT